jgi:hypothetical protein
MRKFLFLISGILLIILSSCQKNKFEDFRKGTFLIPGNQKNVEKYIVVRKGNSQITYKNNLQDKNPEFQLIEWIDRKTYRITYDSSKTKLTESQKRINENNGFIIENIKVEEDCLFYKSTMTLGDEKYEYNSKMCKE